MDTYTTNREVITAFAERNVRSLKNIIYKHWENTWSCRYTYEVQFFVNTINSRINCVTGVAPNKVSAKHESKMIPQIAQQSIKLVRKSNLKPGDKVGIAKEDIPFKNSVHNASLTKFVGIPKVKQSTQPPICCWL